MSNCRISQHMSPKQITVVPAVLADRLTPRASSWNGFSFAGSQNKYDRTHPSKHCSGRFAVSNKCDGSVLSWSEEFGVNLYLGGIWVETRTAPWLFWRVFRFVHKSTGEKTTSFVISVRPSVHTVQLCSEWMFFINFHAVGFYSYLSVNFNLISDLTKNTVRPNYKGKLRDFMLPPRCKPETPLPHTT